MSDFEMHLVMVRPGGASRLTLHTATEKPGVSIRGSRERGGRLSARHGHEPGLALHLHFSSLSSPQFLFLKESQSLVYPRLVACPALLPLQAVEALAVQHQALCPCPVPRASKIAACSVGKTWGPGPPCYRSEKTIRTLCLVRSRGHARYSREQMLINPWFFHFFFFSSFHSSFSRRKGTGWKAD